MFRWLSSTQTYSCYWFWRKAKRRLMQKLFPWI